MYILSKEEKWYIEWALGEFISSKVVANEWDQIKLESLRKRFQESKVRVQLTRVK
jgi:hypothetical protein